jgi:hypothetical protein
MQKNRHHRLPKCRGKATGYPPNNVVRVCPKRHEAWHLLFGVMAPPEVAEYINATWIEPAWRLVAIPQETSHDPPSRLD